MARSFGKKNVVSKDIFDYNIMLLGEAGAGKTTLMADLMRKFCKEDEYLMLQCGKEEGCKAIPNLMWDSVSTWKQFTSLVKEIVENREDWGTLKCICIDTIDQLEDIASPAVVKMWNSSQIGKKDFTPATTLNQAWGGFGKANEKMVNMILDEIWKLKSVGVSTFIVGHTRRRENVDIVSGQTYNTMTASIPLKDFDMIKQKMDIVSMAYIDREMITKEYGRENIMTHKKDMVNEVASEARKIAFRSDAYVLDCKCRFPNIVSEVPMSCEAFVKAIQDAIEDAASGNDTKSTPKKSISKSQPKVEEPKVSEEEPDEDIPFDIDEPETENEFDVASALKEIRAAFKETDAETRKSVRAILSEHGGKLSEDIPVETLKEIMTILNI